MIYILINAAAIFAATLASFFFGAGYYRLAERFERMATDLSPAKLLPLVALAFVAEFWFATILASALILAPSEAGRWTIALAVQWSSGLAS